MNKYLTDKRDELNKQHCDEWTLPHGGPDGQSDWSCSYDEGFNAAMALVEEDIKPVLNIGKGLKWFETHNGRIRSVALYSEKVRELHKKWWEE